LEHLRSQCDAWVLSLFYQQILRPADFSTTTQGCLMRKNARIKFYPAYEQTAKQWRSHIHQLCTNYLATLAHYSQQPAIQLSELATLE
jgi:CRISPR associated protein cas1